MSPPPPSPLTRGDSNTSIEEGLASNNTASQPNKVRENGSRKDIWTLIKDRKEYERRTAPVDEKDAPMETTVMFVGGKSAGKSSLIVRFLDKDEPKTQTMALEYTFCRRTRGVNSIKDIAHIWELGGGTSLTELMSCTFNESNLHTVSFVVAIDLSEPSEILNTLYHFIDKITSRTESLMSGLEQRGSKRPKNLKALAMKKFGTDHPDKDYIKPSVVPIIIVGTKYDVFRDFEPEKRKMICKTLRFIAHMHGASLIFTSQKDDVSTSRFRQQLNSLAFKTTSPKGTQLDYNKPLFIAASSDNLAQIGSPRADKDAMGHYIFVPYERWKSDYNEMFPVKDEKKTEKLDLTRYPENAIDAMRAQKDDELEKIKRQNERKSKEKEFSIPGLAGGGGGKKGGATTTTSSSTGNSYSRSKAANITD